MVGSCVSLYHTRGDAVLVVFGLLVVGDALPLAGWLTSHHGQRRVRPASCGRPPLPAPQRARFPLSTQSQSSLGLCRLPHQARQDGQGSKGQRGRVPTRRRPSRAASQASSTEGTSGRGARSVRPARMRSGRRAPGARRWWRAACREHGPP